MSLKSTFYCYILNKDTICINFILPLILSGSLRQLITNQFESIKQFIVRWIPQYKNTQTHVYHSSLSLERRGFRLALDSSHPVLTLQHEDLSSQHLRVHQLRKPVHGHVHQLGTEDSQELFPDNFSLLPAGIRLCPLWRLPR